jgi:hypothetical protein
VLYVVSLLEYTLWFYTLYCIETYSLVLYVVLYLENGLVLYFVLYLEHTVWFYMLYCIWNTSSYKYVSVPTVLYLSRLCT